MEQKNKKAIPFLILSILGTIFMAFLPCYESIMINGLGDYGVANYKTIFLFVTDLMNLTHNASITLIALLIAIIGIFWIISVILDIVFLIKLMMKKKGHKLIKTLKASWVFSLLYILVLAFFGFRINSIASSQLNIDETIIVPTTIGYVIIAVMVLNYFIFYNLYEKNAEE